MKLQQVKNQFGVTLPRDLVLAFGWEKGTQLKFRVLAKDKLELSKVDSNE